MRVAVVGGGPTGLSAALAFAQKGSHVDLFERVNEPHPGLWIVLGHTGISAARDLGIWDELQKELSRQGCAPIGQYMFVDGTLASTSNLLGSLIRSHDLSVRYGQDMAWVVPREPVQQVLERHVSSVSTNKLLIKKTCTNVNVETGFLYCSNPEDKDSKKEFGPFDLIVGADGTFSTLRKFVAPNYRLLEQDIAFQGVARISREGLSKHITKNFVIGLHTSTPFVITRMSDTTVAYMISLSPNVVEKVLSKEGVTSDVEWQGSRRVSAERWKALLNDEVKHELLLELLKHTSVADFRSFRLRLADPLPVCSYRGKVVLIGDAFHTTAPSTGWGLSLGLSDAIVLAQLCTKNESNVSSTKLELTLEAFDRKQRRVWNAFLQQSLVTKNHFGTASLHIDRIVLSLLPTSLFLKNYDIVCSPVQSEMCFRPLRVKYLYVVAFFILGVCAWIGNFFV